MSKKRFGIISALLLFAASAFTLFVKGQNFPGASGNPSILSRPGGTFYAPAFSWNGRVVSGNSTTGSQSIIIAGNAAGGAGGLQLADGSTISLQTVFSTLTPIIVDYGQGAQETVTPTAVSVGTCPAGNLGVGGSLQCATVTASFVNTHGQSAVVADATFGLQTAINYAQGIGGGIVSIDNAWTQMGGTDALIAAAVPFTGVAIQDLSGNMQYWNIQQTASTFLATPTTLTAVTALPSATPVGAFGTGTYHLAIAYVDIAGQVGPESADFSEAGLATGSFIFSAPAASSGAVGYVIYISLTGGTYSLDYEVPLTSSICTLTKVETTTPACAVANTTYGQSGATATVTAITVNTSPVGMLLGGVSGTLLTGNPNGRTTYSYVASNHIGANGITTVNLPFTVGGIGSATPIAIGTVNLPPAFMNQVGKTIRVCGKFLNTDVNSSIQNIDIYLDGAGSDVAGSPVKIGGLAATGTGTAAAYEGSFCDTFITTVSGASVTAGSIMPSFGNLQYALVSSGNIVGNGADTKAAATGSINLAGGAGFETRLSIVHTNTTGNATPQLQSLTLEVL